MSNSDLCEHCGSYWDYHDYEHLARTCYPLQIEKLQAKLNQAEGVIMMRDATIEQMIDMRHEPPTPPKAKTRASECAWKYDDIDDYYETTCGEAHCLIDGTLAENKHKFCPYCGGSIIEVRPLDSPPQE